jgi:Tfp pilus assembly protein PilF
VTARTVPPGRWAITSGLAVGIAAVTALAFANARWAGFLAWDDHANFVVNPHYRGLGPAQLWWILTNAWSGHWTPLTWLTLSLDWVLWGRDPLGYHLTNVAWHAANAVVLFAIALQLLTRALPDSSPAIVRAGAAVAALVFSLHPLRVESVVWVSERRDVVSGFFYLLTVATYLSASAAVGPARRRWLALSIVSYALAMASKAIVMSLPIVLVVLDVYPLRRLPTRWRAVLERPWRPVLLEKVPYLVIALAGAVVAATVVADVKSTADYPLWARPLVFGDNLAFYLRKTLVATDLSPLYEMPIVWVATDARRLVGVLVSVSITLALLAAGRRWPAGLAVWIAYVVTLAPVAGLAVAAGPQVAADRYTYLACLGLALLAGAAVCRLASWSSIEAGLRRTALGAIALGLAGLAWLTWQQSLIWRDDLSLWQHAVLVDPTCARCQGNLGNALRDRAPHAAVAPLRQAVALRPDMPSLHANLGLVLLGLGRPAEALPHLEQAAAGDPDDLILQTHLGAALGQAGDLATARRQLDAVLQRRPDFVDALINMGFTLAADGRPAEALGYFERAALRAPRATAARAGLVHAYSALGDRAAAERELAVLRALDPRLGEELGRR